MIKKISIFLLVLGVSYIISLLLDSYLRKQIFDLYKWTTKNKIIFTGKGFYFFPSICFVISFTISLSILVLNLINNKHQVIKNIILWFIIFIFSTIIISAIHANILVIECTSCESGIRKISYYKVKYGLILAISSFLSLTPIFFNFLKGENNRRNNLVSKQV